MSKMKLGKVNMVILSSALLLSVFFTVVAVYNGFDGWSALKSNLVTFSLIVFLIFSAYLNYEKLTRILYLYIICSFLYIGLDLYFLDFNIWRLRHADDVLLLGWPTNTPLIFAVAYLFIDQSEISKIRKLLAKSFCTFIILVTLNRVSVLFILIIVILDLMRSSYRSLTWFLITITLLLTAIYNFAWISEHTSTFLRFGDTLNSFSIESSIGHRFFVTWKLAIDTIITYPYFGTGGVGMSGLEPINTSNDLTTESVFLDTIMRYGLILGITILIFYHVILYQIWKLLRHNILVYPIVCMFIVSFSMSDIMRFPHIIILLSTFYGYAKWSKNADKYS